jgi:hypothetical protein
VQHSRVVHENINASQFLLHFLEGTQNFLFLGDVTFDRVQLSWALRQAIGQLLQKQIPLKIVNENTGQPGLGTRHMQNGYL